MEAVLEISKKLINLYKGTLDTKELSNYVSDDVSYIFFNSEKERHGKTNFFSYLKHVKDLFKNCIIIDEKYTKHLSEYSELVYVSLKFADFEKQNEFYIALTLFFELSQDDIKLVHFHSSRPDIGSKSSFDDVSDGYKTLYDYACASTAGFVKVALDDNLTIMDASENYYKLLGYTKDEMEYVGGSFMYPIVEEDYEKVIYAITNTSRSFPIDFEFDIKTGNMEKNHILANITIPKTPEVFNDQLVNVVYCVLSDITVLNESKTQLKYEMEKYRIFSEISDDINFEYDVKNDIFYFNDNFQNYFSKKVIPDFKNHITNSDAISSDDLPEVISFFNNHLYRKDFYIEMRLKTLRGTIWFSIKTKKCESDNNSDEKIIYGKLTNINEHKKENERLLEKSRTDMLTRLLNKATTESEISDYLRNDISDELSALIIVDIDNFKKINDTFGHLYGDAVLKEVSYHLKKLFRSSDIVGRIGGDEFVVFMKNAFSSDVIEAKAKTLVKTLKIDYKQNDLTISISTSIGICTTDCADDYRSLFKFADTALYYSKSNGKNQYNIYNEEMKNKKLVVPERQDTAIPVSTQKSYNDIAIKVFDIIYQSDNLIDSMKTALEIILHTFNVNRVYICLIEDSLRTVSCVFEETTENIVSILKYIQDRPIDVNYDIFSLFNSDGVFYCNDISELPPEWKEEFSSWHSVAILQYMIYYKGKLLGYIGIDDCFSKRLWCQSEINALGIFAKILSEYLERI